jgi:phosphodiesterase/alkaline phosphatase D-like protein
MDDKYGSSSIEHSVVHYGADPCTIHRVSVMNLTPGTTYYYKVESVRGDGTPLGGRSNTINQFTTHQHP